MRGSAVPTIVWSRAASSSASITPTVASTLMRVDSSACGMTLFLLGAHRLDHSQTHMTELNQLRVLEASGQRLLAGYRITPKRLHPLPALLGDLGVDRAPVVRIIDSSHQAVAHQVVNQPGDRSGRDVEHRREIPHGAAAIRDVLQPHKDLKAALAQPMPVGPALHGRMHLLAQKADRSQSFCPR